MRGRTEPGPGPASIVIPTAGHGCRSLFQAVLAAIAFMASAPGSISGGEIDWSPDGNWLAFTQRSSATVTDRIRPGWLFRPGDFANQGEPVSESSGTCKLWIVRADYGILYEIDRSDELISDPCWSPDGGSLFYTRIIRKPGGGYVWSLHEVSEVSRSGTNSRILRQIELPGGWNLPRVGDKASIVLRQIHAGSGGLIVHGDPVQSEPVLYDSISQEVRARFPEGYNARVGSGGQFVAWLRSDDWPTREAEIMLTDLSDGQSKSSNHFLPDAIPVFSADGRSIYAGRHQKPPVAFAVPAGSIWPDIAKIDLQTFKAERYSRPIATPILPTEELVGLSVALDAAEETLICAPSIRNRPAEISWFQPKTAATYKRFPPLDVVTNATNLAISPDQRLALRLGTPESPQETSTLPAAICDPRTEVLRPLVPDDTNRSAWIDFLARAALRNMQDAAADKSLPDSSVISRMSILPVLGEIRPETPASSRTKRIGNTGLSALGFDPKNPDIEVLEGLKPEYREAACLFFALTGRYDAALTALGAVNAEGFEEDLRFRRYAVIAELNIAAGNIPEGSLILEALDSGEPRFLGELLTDGMGGWILEPRPASARKVFMDRLERLIREASQVSERRVNDSIPGGLEVTPTGVRPETGVAPP